jgi:hypothetical protein
VSQKFLIGLVALAVVMASMFVGCVEEEVPEATPTPTPAPTPTPEATETIPVEEYNLQIADIENVGLVYWTEYNKYTIESIWFSITNNGNSNVNLGDFYLTIDVNNIQYDEQAEFHSSGYYPEVIMDDYILSPGEKQQAILMTLNPEYLGGNILNVGLQIKKDGFLITSYQFELDTKTDVAEII